jgi:hypothetical protein
VLQGSRLSTTTGRSATSPPTSSAVTSPGRKQVRPFAVV